MSIKDYEFWFVVGTQFLYGEDIFETIDDGSSPAENGDAKDGGAE